MMSRDSLKGNYYFISDISGLHPGDRLKTAVHCFTEPL